MNNRAYIWDMNNAQNTSKMELLAKDIKPGMIVKWARWYMTVETVEVCYHKNGNPYIATTGKTYPTYDRKMRATRPGGRPISGGYNKLDAKVTWKHI